MKKFALEEQKKKEAKGEKMAEDDLDAWMKEENDSMHFVFYFFNFLFFQFFYLFIYFILIYILMLIVCILSLFIIYYLLFIYYRFINILLFIIYH